MSLSADIIVDRRRLKRSLTFWRIVAVVAVVAAAVAAAGRFDLPIRKDHVARIDVEGLILEDAARDEALRAVAEDDKAKALIVAVNSPGGIYVGGENLYLELRAVAEKKPVVAIMGGTATSAAYMVAIAADRVFARSGSLTGSIGVIMQTADLTGLMEKIGIKPETIKSGPMKAQPNPMEPFSPEARAVTEDMIREFYGMFVDMIVERRGLDRTKVRELADGRLFSGRRAKTHGLIDAIGGEDTARQWLADEHGISADLPISDVEIEYDDEPWREYLGETLGKALFSERLRLDGVISLWQPERWF